MNAWAGRRAVLTGALLLAWPVLAQNGPIAPNSPLANPPAGNYRYDPGSPQGYVPVEPYAPRLQPGPDTSAQPPQALAPGYGNGIRSLAPPASAAPLPYGDDYRATVRIRAEPSRKPATVSRLTEIAPYVASCARWPENGGGRTVELTLRVAYTRSGEVLGEPRIVYTSPGLEGEARNRYHEALLTAVSHCAPLPLGHNFGAALAGKLITIRFIDDPRSRKGQTPT